MKIIIESTDQVVTLVTPTGDVPARLWTGTTERGIPIHVLVTRIAVREDADNSQFQAELKETPTPRPDINVFPLRMVL